MSVDPAPAFDARAVANAILDLAESARQSVYPTSLLKLLYFGHGWHLARFDRPLIGQPFEAWQYGPVVRVVFDQVRDFSGRPITGRLKAFNAGAGAFEEARVDLPPSTRSLLAAVVGAYGPLHPFELSDLTHEADSPWTRAWRAAEEGKRPGVRIENSEIKEYFLRLNAADML